MVKHNNAIPNTHLRKHWKKFVKCWFDQPARKRRRQAARVAKAESVFPRPLHHLRPIVRKPTARYNSQTRLGRGFSLRELRAAGLNSSWARSVGISVDHRRQNNSVEAFQANVKRLQEYKERLILWPRHGDETKKGLVNDTAKDKLSSLQPNQVADKTVLALPKRSLRCKPQKITDALTKVWATKPIADAKAKRRRAKKEEAAAKEKAAADKKAAKA